MANNKTIENYAWPKMFFDDILGAAVSPLVVSEISLTRLKVYKWKLHSSFNYRSKAKRENIQDSVYTD